MVKLVHMRLCITAGTVQVSVSASDVELEDGSPAKQKSRPASVGIREKHLIAQLNVELLETTLIEVRNLRKVALSGHEPRSLVRRKTLLHSIRQLTRYRREITDIDEGSVVFCIKCQTVRALNDLWTLCRSGRLRDALRSDFVTDALLSKYRLRNFDFVVSFSEVEYWLCKQELSTGLFFVFSNCCCKKGLSLLQHYDASFIVYLLLLLFTASELTTLWHYTNACRSRSDVPSIIT